MRFRLRLILVSCTFFVLASGLFFSDGPTLPPSYHHAQAAAGATDADDGTETGTASGIGEVTEPPSTPPRPEPGDDRAPARPAPPRVAPRARSHDAVLIAARLTPGAIEASDLRRFWMEAVDRGAPGDAVEALRVVARANRDRPTIAHAALDYRDDLLALRRAAQTSVTRRASADEADALPPHEAIAHEQAMAIDHSTESPRPLIDAEWRDELADVIRYGSEPGDVSEAIAVMALDRSEATSRALLDGVDHPGPDQRLSALTALWRAAADRTADREQVRDAWDRARFDPDPEIAARAASVLADLDRLATASADAEGATDADRTATARPIEVEADADRAS